MFDFERGIDSLTNFKRRSAEYINQLNETGEPVVLTVNGKAQVVVQNASAYQRLAAIAAKAEREATLVTIQDGLDDVEAGRTHPARAALNSLAEKFGISENPS